MKNHILFLLIAAIMLAGCSSSHNEETDDHAAAKTKIQLTVYSSDFELFAEADPFVAGQPSNVLAHFTHLTDFKPVQSGSITLRLSAGGGESSVGLERPTRTGIYSFDIKPESAGEGSLNFDIEMEGKKYQVVVPAVTVYKDEASAEAAAKAAIKSRTNTVVFTKEQSWKVDFSTASPETGLFGQVIKTTARVQSAQGDQVVVPARTSGVVIIPGINLAEGKMVAAGEKVFIISGSTMADNNTSVRYAEALANYEKTKAEFDRQSTLVSEKIVSAREFAETKNRYENARAVYENLNSNFSAAGQPVSSPMAGYVKELFVRNGQYVETGQPLFTVSQNRELILRAEVQAKYAPLLGGISAVNIRTLHDNRTYSGGELNAKVVSYGRSTTDESYLIPVTLRIDNKGALVAGSFVEIFLKVTSGNPAITVPNSAIMEEQGNHFLFVQIHPELFERRQVKTGATDGVRTAITQGITGNDRVVCQGAILVKLSQASGTLDAHAGHVH